MSDKKLPFSTVSAADFSRNFGEWHARALKEPVTITHYNQARLILSSVEVFYERGSDFASLTKTRTINNQLKAIINKIPEAFIAFDSILRVIDCNHAAESYLEIPREDIINRDLRDVIPRSRGSVAWEFYQRVIRTGQAHEFTTKSSVRESTNLKIHAFPYDGGVAIIFTNFDLIVESRRFEARLDALRELVCKDSSRSVISMNTRGGIEQVDEAFKAMTGLELEQLQTLFLTDIVVARDRREVLQGVDQSIKKKQSVAVEAAIMGHEGQEIPTHMHFSVVSSEVAPEEIMVMINI